MAAFLRKYTLVSATYGRGITVPICLKRGSRAVLSGCATIIPILIVCWLHGRVMDADGAIIPFCR